MTRLDVLRMIAARTRADAHAVGFYSGGALQYRPVKAPLTDELLHQHLASAYLAGAYFIAPGSDLVLVAAFDLDDKSGENWPRLVDAARRIIARCEAHGLSVLA